MSKHKFKAGDKVKLDGVEYCLAHYGIPERYAKKTGTVSHQYQSGSILVEFDDGRRFFAPGYLGIAINEKIIIYRNDNQVIAKNTLTGKTGVAKCNPADEFDFNTGAKLAFDRLVEPEPEEPKYYSGKVVCIDNSGFSNTKGKIYKVLDGKLEFDSGLYSDKRFESVGQINNSLRSKFIELVE